MATTAKKNPVAQALDSIGTRLIRAVGMTGETASVATGKRDGASKMAADHLYSLGWRTDTIKAKVEANGERRSQIRAAIYSGFSAEKQQLVSITGDALEGLKEKKKNGKTLFDVRREAMQASGAYFALIEKALAALEEAEKQKAMTDEEKKEAEATAKKENTSVAKVQKMMDSVIKLLQGIENPPEGVDIPTAIKRAKALKGGLPTA